jgi:hypothetical protein
MRKEKYKATRQNLSLSCIQIMKKLIKNYTTDIPAEKTIAEIHTLLAQNGARGIATDYDENGLVTDVFFKIFVKGRELPFRLPAKADQVYEALFADKPGENVYGESRRIKAQNIAWRICKAWLEAQITLINLQQAKIEEVFLPYMVMPSNKTLYEEMKNNQFLLPSGK